MEWARRRSRGIAIDYFDIAAAILSGAWPPSERLPSDGRHMFFLHGAFVASRLDFTACYWFPPRFTWLEKADWFYCFLPSFTVFFFLCTPRFRKFILSILLSLYFFRNYWVLSHQMSCIAKEKVAIRTPGVSNDKFLLEQRRPHGGVDRPHNPLDASFYCRAFPKATAGIFVLSWKPGKTQ